MTDTAVMPITKVGTGGDSAWELKATIRVGLSIFKLKLSLSIATAVVWNGGCVSIIEGGPRYGYTLTFMRDVMIRLYVHHQRANPGHISSTSTLILFCVSSSSLPFLHLSKARRSG